MKIVVLLDPIEEKSISDAGIRGMKAGQLLREELEAKNKGGKEKKKDRRSY